MHMKQMLEKLAYLEFVNDQLTAELDYVNKLLRVIGFQEGLKTVKNAAREIIEQERLEREKRQEQKDSDQDGPGLENLDSDENSQ